ncbi:MAG: hypothetical protein LQ342_004247 [Letrouitia transgressa]|nr:MAG: hypothetical protein LQ342_004247 [Letrouitia transgressa]
MGSLLTPLNGTTKVADEQVRIKSQDALRSAADALETPHDTMLRLFNSVFKTPFETLAESPKAITVEDLATQSGAEPLLLGRILRYLASRRLIAENGKDAFTANGATEALADPRINGAMYYTFDISGPVYQAIPDHLKATSYQNSGSKYVWHTAMSTDQDFFPWAKQHPEQIKWFQQLMSVPREGDWLDVAPFQDVSVESERALFVDVGGSIGHQCARLKQKFPDLKGRIVLQDLEETIKNAPPIEGVEMMSHDFFKAQPIKGAKFYYLRTVLHDWDEAKSLAILENLKAAMAPDSRILIDEMALPNTGVHWWSACLDLHMYAMLGALERNEEQWNSLLDKAGLVVEDIRVYTPTMRSSVIVARLK